MANFQMSLNKTQILITQTQKELNPKNNKKNLNKPIKFLLKPQKYHKAQVNMLPVHESFRFLSYSIICGSCLADL